MLQQMGLGKDRRDYEKLFLLICALLGHQLRRYIMIIYGGIKTLSGYIPQLSESCFWG